MKETVLITGGSGLLGLNWALSTREEYDVTLGLHKREVVLNDVNSIHLNLESISSILNTLDKIKPDVIVHTAGLTNIEECESHPDLAYQVNVILAENVAKACVRQGVSLVHISTDHLFSGDTQMVSEDQVPEPVNEYAKTKAEAENRVLDVDPDALSIRTNFYGWGPSYRKSFSDYIYTALSKGHRPILYQDAFYTPILAGELARVVHDLIKHDANGIFHVAGDERLSKYEFGLKIASHFQFDAKLINPGSLAEQSSMVSRPFDMSLSNKKTCTLLGRALGGVDEHLELLKHQHTNQSAQEIAKL